MKGVQCYELFGGIALKNHTFSFFTLTVVQAPRHKYMVLGSKFSLVFVVVVFFCFAVCIVSV